MQKNPFDIGHLHGSKVTVQKELGAGMSATGFLVDMLDEKLALKWAHNGDAYQDSVLKAVKTHLWIQQNSNLNVPELMDYSSSGRWSLSKFIDGESVEEILSKRNLTNAETSDLIEVFKEANRVYDAYKIYLDISPDNIIIKEGKPYLIDLGAVSGARSFVAPTDVLRSWEKIYSPLRVKSNEPKVCKKVI